MRRSLSSFKAEFLLNLQKIKNKFEILNFWMIFWMMNLLPTRTLDP